MPGENVKNPTSEAGVGEEDLSMEEILQSIRRIIAEDDKDGKKTGGAEPMQTNGSAAHAAEEDVPGSNVLELTEMLKDDGTVVSLQPGAETSAAEEAGDILSKIDEALAAPDPVPDPVPAPVPVPSVPVMEAAPVAPAPEEADSLISTAAAAASAEAFRRLRSAGKEIPAAPSPPAPSFRDGTTVEDLVTEMLRPMMKTWLDNNLPKIVERIVEREVRKLTQ